MFPDQALQVRELPFRDGANGGAQAKDRGVRQPIGDKEALFPALDQCRPPEGLKMLRRVRERESQLLRQGVDGPLPLREQLEHLEPLRAREGLADPGELPVEAVLEVAVRVAAH